MGRRKISSTLLNTLMCGETGRISRVGSFVELENSSTKMMSSFDLCQVLTYVKFCQCRRRIFTYELSLEIQKYRLQCGRIYEIVGKFWVDVAYGVQGAAAFLGICVLKLWEAALPWLWMRTHRRRVFIRPAAGGGYITFLVLLKQKIDAFRVVQNRQNSIKIHLKSFKIDKNSF